MFFENWIVGCVERIGIMEKVEFNLENVLNGTYTQSVNKGGRSGGWSMHNSLRLLEESGQEFSPKMKDMLTKMKYKWTYNNRKSDENKGNIIVKLHIKNEPESYYIVVTQKGKATQYNTLQEAKDNLDLE